MSVLQTILKWISVNIVIGGVALSSSAAPERLATQHACERTPTPSCLVDMATAFAETLPPGVARSEVFTEIAYAHHAGGDPQAAQDMLGHALSAATAFDDPKQEALALLRIAEAQAATGFHNQARKVVGQALTFEDDMPLAVDRSNIVGTAAKVYASLGDFDVALTLADSLPEGEANLASIKARTYHDVGPLQARAGFVEDGLATVQSATTGLQYYRASALTDIAKVLFERGEVDHAHALLDEAQDIGASLEDGYFVAGALRHVGEAASHGGQMDRAIEAYRAAVAGTQTQPMGQARARALSRAATAMAESGFVDQAREVLAQAVVVAEAEDNEVMRQYAFYEIAGSFAFAGAIAEAADIANALPDRSFSSAQSLRGVTLRDVAWGEAKHVAASEAVARALSISSTREKVMALSRIARVLVDSEMKSLSRYL